MIYYIATITDDLDFHWSEVIWGDGYEPDDILTEARVMAQFARANPGRLEVFGPFELDMKNPALGANYP